MSEIKSHKDLEVWKLAMALVEKVYQITNSFPTSEQFGLTSQIRRSAVSVPSNIAEGAGRKNTKEFIHFLYISLGSIAELDTQLEISQQIGYIKDYNVFEEKIKAIRIMLSKLIISLKNKLK